MMDEHDARLERLSRRVDHSAETNAGYTRFVRAMRLALPSAALILLTVLFVDTGVNEATIAPMEEGEAPMVKDKRIAKNELLNPKFESRDKENQPYKITADRAIQGEVNKDLIMLERPVGVMDMGAGAQVQVVSDTGAYRQDTERFLLEGAVVMQHSDGYTLNTEEAHIDLKRNFAWSEKDVLGIGPDMVIDAKGVRANGETGEVVFAGPAKLVLEKGFEGAKK